jgi:hypothetical protein
MFHGYFKIRLLHHYTNISHMIRARIEVSSNFQLFPATSTVARYWGLTAIATNYVTLMETVLIMFLRPISHGQCDMYIPADFPRTPPALISQQFDLPWTTRGPRRSCPPLHRTWSPPSSGIAHGRFEALQPFCWTLRAFSVSDSARREAATYTQDNINIE